LKCSCALLCKQQKIGKAVIKKVLPFLTLQESLYRLFEILEALALEKN
jgi:hypothetical protein